jgi:hypothetical protein
VVQLPLGQVAQVLLLGQPPRRCLRRLRPSWPLGLRPW